MSIKTLPLTIVGAAENNLKDVSLELEHDTYTVVTGLSGSGKSSLAFSTVYAEGQRRYIETFSPYTRQFLDRLKKPNVLSVENVRPAIAIQQKTRVVSSRSTVGSMTNANDLLKILYANLAEPHSPTTGEKLVSFSSSDIVDALILWEQKAPQGLTGLVAAPLQLPSTKKGRTQELARLSLLGFSRCFDTCSRSIKKIETLSPGDISGDELLLVLTRFQTGKIKAKELRESVTQAYELSRGKAAVIFPDVDKNVLTSLPRIDGEMARFSETYQTADAHSEQLPFEIPKRRAPLFDPNSNIGACPKCTGFGYVLELDEKKLVPNDSLSLQQGAIHPWRTSSDANLEKKLFRFCEAHKISLDQPWRALSPMKRELIMEHKERGYTGLIPWFRWLERKSYKMHVRVFLSRYRSQFLCELCAGGRLKPEALCFKIAGKNLHDIWNTPVQEVLDWSEDLLQKLDGSPHQSRDLREVAERLKGRLLYLRDLGLPYITLGRPSRTLSGGETQRVNLTTALGSELVSTHFVLDEPSVGLHPRDTERLMKSMRELQQKGNSVLVVEHDTDCIAAADRIVELGPKAGNEGGKIVFNGPISEWGGIEDRAELPKPRTLPKEFPKLLTLSGASSRNLKDISVSLPIGFFSVITGVSGSGKSTLVTEELLPAWEEFTQRGTTNRCSGFENFKQVLLVDQSSLTKSPRANIATYTGVWDAFRTALSSTESAEKRSLTKSSFSFNVEGGRCPVCKGAGYLKEDMQFLSDVYVQCEECLGHRFQPKVLEVTYEEKNVSDWLNCSISELPSLLPDQRTISRVAEYLTILGLGHLRLGHPLSELSGGEAQRLKLVPFLEKADRGESLLIFDEPTTGLHLHDVRKLIALLRDLTVRGHTVLCIEHNQELILGADHIIDLGPEGGDLGGQVLLAGPPDAFLTNTESPSYTAQFLKDYVVAAKEGQRLRAPQKKESTSIGLQPLLIRGAREHNLKNINVELPHNEVIAITGVSGSGKSTLAKDIIYAEGQRRYLDCLSPYARQFIRELTKPDVDEIKNIRP
ncbi:MAG: excinuclease ABC subunit UvrA, partial [Bdellovibrionales bacterium]|nr:excinuclease ABC subunit UvrA [Bdellovibrionales bacterium]